MCIDNERHHFLRPGYSYKGIENFNKKVKFLKNDGIWHIDCKTKKIKQIITLEQLLNINYLSTMKDAIHYVEHLMINPNDTFMQYILKTNVETHMLFNSKKDVVNFMESINHNIVWKAICILDNFKTKLVTILQSSHKENKLSSKTFDKNNYIIEKKSPRA